MGKRAQGQAPCGPGPIQPHSWGLRHGGTGVNTPLTSVGLSQREGPGSSPKPHSDNSSRPGLQVGRAGRSHCVDHASRGRCSPRLQPEHLLSSHPAEWVACPVSLAGPDPPLGWLEGAGLLEAELAPQPAEEGRTGVVPGPRQPALGWEGATWGCSAARLEPRVPWLLAVPDLRRAGTQVSEVLGA